MTGEWAVRPGGVCTVVQGEVDLTTNPALLLTSCVMLGKSLSSGSLTWDNDLTLWGCCVD